MIFGLFFFIIALSCSLKSNEQLCSVGYRCIPQNIIPHLHFISVNFNFLLHIIHLDIIYFIYIIIYYD